MRQPKAGPPLAERMQEQLLLNVRNSGARYEVSNGVRNFGGRCELSSPPRIEYGVNSSGDPVIARNCREGIKYF